MQLSNVLPSWICMLIGVLRFSRTVMANIDCCSGEGGGRRAGGRGAEDSGGVDGSGAAERRTGRSAGGRPAQVSYCC